VISTKKLAALPRLPRLRKIAKMLGEAEARFCNSGAWDYPLADLAAALELLALDGEFPPAIAPAVAEAAALARRQLSAFRTEPPAEGRAESLRRAINAARHIVLAETGDSPADWDFLNADNKLDAAKRRVFPGMRVFLEDIRSPFNVGSLFRTAESFGVEKILLSPLAADPLHPRAMRTAMGCVEVLPWERLPVEALDTAGMPIFALETGGAALNTFPFPTSGILIAGSEELGVSPAALSAAESSLGRVSIGVYGAKGSLGVAAAFAIAVQAWAERLAAQ
jgi:TrmH family RNA methyltransferase